jgi:hypothetical protein
MRNVRSSVRTSKDWPAIVRFASERAEFNEEKEKGKGAKRTKSQLCDREKVMQLQDLILILDERDQG